MKMAPTLVTACTSLHLAGRRSPEASLLLSVQTCAGRFGAAGSSPSEAELAWGDPSEKWLAVKRVISSPK